MGFLGAALMCFNLLAWPLFSLGFPLYASVRALETNSMQEMRALVAYWILFSLISRFELAFGKLIQWLPFWPYIKLITICWLVLPWFNGACYVYEHLIHRWLSVNLKELVNLIFEPKKSTSLDAERFPGEPLKKLIAGQPEHRNPDVDVEEIKAATNTEEKGTAAAMLSPPKVPNVAKENAKVGELEEKDLATIKRGAKPNASENKRGSSSTGGWEHEKANSGDNPSSSKPKGQENKGQPKQERQKIRDLFYAAYTCHVSCTSEIDFESHLRGTLGSLDLESLLRGTLDSSGGWTSQG